MHRTEYPDRKNPVIGEKIVQGLVVGRDKKVVPPSEVEHLASLGCPDRDISSYFGIAENTLRYNFGPELVKGRHQLKTRLRQAQLRVALDGNATLLIWLGKNILGQSDTPESADNNRVLPFTDEELDEIKDDLEEELNELDATEQGAATDSAQ